MKIFDVMILKGYVIHTRLGIIKFTVLGLKMVSNLSQVLSC